MALIRNAEAESMARDAIVLDLGDLQRQGERILADARSKAERVLEDARRERERLVSGAAEEGREKGYREGIERGREEGLRAGRDEALGATRESLERLDVGWSSALDQFVSARQRMLVEAKDDVVRLAVAIAEKIVKRRIEHDPAAVVDQVEAVLEMLVRPTALLIRVHPEDKELVSDALPGLIAKFPAAGHAEIAEDGTLERGSCVVGSRDAAGGQIDASIATQLDRIAEALLPGEREKGTSA